jgi:hypothetical protein
MMNENSGTVWAKSETRDDSIRFRGCPANPGRLATLSVRLVQVFRKRPDSNSLRGVSARLEVTVVDEKTRCCELLGNRC